MFRIAVLVVVLGFTAEIEQSHAFVPRSPSPTAGSRRYASVATTTPPDVAPLPPHTFAGQVEQGMIQRFGGEEPIERVLKSWRWLENNY